MFTIRAKGGAPVGHSCPRRTIAFSRIRMRMIQRFRAMLESLRPYFSGPLGIAHNPVVTFGLWQWVHSPWKFFTKTLLSPPP